MSEKYSAIMNFRLFLMYKKCLKNRLYTTLNRWQIFYLISCYFGRKTLKQFCSSVYNLHTFHHRHNTLQICLQIFYHCGISFII
jgi:hypothetical protein